MSTAQVPVKCREVLDDEAILVIDGGNTAVWASYYHEVRAVNTLLSTYKFGMLGAGVSQAIGAKAACPIARCAASSATARWDFTPRRSRRRSATGFR
jgi:acetolactate synthase-1/2/3 large subunit